ncbi:MAG: TraR/DksA C4-type zinc finger protein [Candidatus Limnocylindrales bacterium]
MQARSDRSPASNAAADAALQVEARRLREELGEPIEGPDQMTYGSQAAAASQVFAQQRDLALRDRERIQLRLVEEALARLDSGTYGTCVECGKPTGNERLEAIPWAATCIDCARTTGR